MADESLEQFKMRMATLPTPVPAASERMTLNTDRELYREPDTTGNGEFYSDSIHVTQAGGIGINVGGTVIVMPLQAWHRLALLPQPDRAKADEEAVEFRRVILETLWDKPEFKSAKWGNSEDCKNGWGFPFEFINWLYRERSTLSARAEAAEARAETARATALEEAAKIADNWIGARGPIGAANDAGMSFAGQKIAEAIRALRTAPPPTAGREG